MWGRAGGVFLAAALAVAACRTPAAKTTYEASGMASDASAEGLSAQLGAGDVIEVRVFQEPDLTGLFRVAPDGTIDYPFCGSLKVLGLSPGETSQLIERCLSAGYLKRPQVTVFLKELNSRKVFVFGEVQKPGTFAFEEGMTVVQAVSLAGGFTKLASKNSVVVTRTTGGTERKIKVPVEAIGQGTERNFALQPGDVVFVPESYF